MLLVGRYIPDATGAIYDVLKEMAQLHASKKKRYEVDDADVLRKVSAHLITKQTLSEKLAKHVEQVGSLFYFLLFYVYQIGELLDFVFLFPIHLIFALNHILTCIV